MFLKRQINDWLGRVHGLATHKSRAGADFGKLFMGFILIIIGLALFPSISTAVTTALVNATGLAATLLAMIPWIWVLVVVGIGVAMVYEQFSGM